MNTEASFSFMEKLWNLIHVSSYEEKTCEPYFAA
jgi:hypothetical protein